MNDKVPHLLSISLMERLLFILVQIYGGIPVHSLSISRRDFHQFSENDKPRDLYLLSLGLVDESLSIPDKTNGGIPTYSLQFNKNKWKASGIFSLGLMDEFLSFAAKLMEGFPYILCRPDGEIFI